jgi:hypothetical protein
MPTATLLSSLDKVNKAPDSVSKALVSGNRALSEDLLASKVLALVRDSIQRDLLLTKVKELTSTPTLEVRATQLLPVRLDRTVVLDLL